MNQGFEPAWIRPQSLPEALQRLAEGGWIPLAGGTDVHPPRAGLAEPAAVLDLGGLPELRGVTLASGRRENPENGSFHRLGALTTWSQLRRAALPAGLRAVQEAAAEVGGVQIQNLGTVGGNLCHASPAADGVVALLALDARVELARSRDGAIERRELSLDDFLQGVRRTARAPEELLVQVHLPAGSPAARSRFLKLGHRRTLVISIAMVAVAADLGPDGRLTHCGVAVGACSARARRLSSLERSLTGLPPAQARGQLEALLDEAALAPLSPLDDVRGTADYRRDAARTLVMRALDDLLAEMSS